MSPAAPDAARMEARAARFEARVRAAQVAAPPTRRLVTDAVRRRDQAPRPVALVLGNEEEGLSAEVAAACTRLVTIPGTGRVE